MSYYALTIRSDDFTVPVILGDHVTTDGGTGLVHTAPDHGLDDFIVGQKYNLPMAGLVSNDGKFISTTEFLCRQRRI